MKKKSFWAKIFLLAFIVAWVMFLWAMTGCQKCASCRQITTKQVIVLKGVAPAPPSDTTIGQPYQFCGFELQTALTQAPDVTQQYCGSIQADTATGQTYIIDSAYRITTVTKWSCSALN